MKTKHFIFFALLGFMTEGQSFGQSELSKKYILYGRSITTQPANSAAVLYPAYAYDNHYCISSPDAAIWTITYENGVQIPIYFDRAQQEVSRGNWLTTHEFWHSVDHFSPVRMGVNIPPQWGYSPPSGSTGMYRYPSGWFRYLDTSQIGEWGAPVVDYEFNKDVHTQMFFSVCPNHQATIKPLGDKNVFRQDKPIIFEAVGSRVNQYLDEDFWWEYSLDGIHFIPPKVNFDEHYEFFRPEHENTIKFSGKRLQIMFSDLQGAEFGKPIYMRLKSCGGFSYPDGNAPISLPEVFTVVPEFPEFDYPSYTLKTPCPNKAPEPLSLFFQRGLEENEIITEAYLHQGVDANGKPIGLQKVNFTILSDYFGINDGISVQPTTALADGTYYLQVQGTIAGVAASSKSTKIVVKNFPVLDFETTVSPTSGTAYNQGVPNIAKDGKIEIKTKNYDTCTFEWTLVGGNPFDKPVKTSGKTADFEGLATGDYRISITYNEGQCDTTFIVHVGVSPDFLDIRVKEIGSILCSGKPDATLSVNIFQKSAKQIIFSFGKTMSPQTFYVQDTTLIFKHLPAGKHTVYVTDGKLYSSASITVKEPEPLKINLVSKADPSCYGFSDGHIHVSATGGRAPYQYMWNGKPGSEFFDKAPAGTHLFAVMDGKGCITGDTIILTNPPKMQVVLRNVKRPLCSYSADGLIDIRVNGGTGKHTWKWHEHSNTTSTLSNIYAGTYTYVVSDENSCTLSEKIQLIAPKALKIDTIEQIEQTYFGSELGVETPSDSSGLIRVSARQGTPPYTYQWSTGCTDSVLTDLSFGLFFVVVSDGHGCTEVAHFELAERLPLTAVLQQTDSIACFGDRSAVLSANVSGGVPPYVYRWKHDNSSSLQQNQLDVGLYEFEVEDSRGVRSFDRIFVSQPEPLQAVLSADSVSGWGASDGAVHAIASGGTPPYQYDWRCSTAASVGGLSAGIYPFRLTDAHFCIVEDTIEIYSPKKLIMTSQKYDCSYFGAVQGKVEVAPNDGRIACWTEGGVPPYRYQWFYQQNNSDWILLLSKTTSFADSLPKGRYTVWVTDSKGYAVSDTFDIFQAEPLTATLSAIYPRCFGEASGSLKAQVSGGFPPYSYRWNMEGTADSLTSLRAGFYSIVVTDSLGVQSTFEQFLTQPEILNVDYSIQEITGHDLCNGAIHASARGGTKPYTYIWTYCDTICRDTQISDLCAGFYPLQVVDSNGCLWTSSFALNNPEALKIDGFIKPVSYLGSVQGHVAPAPTDGEIRLTVSGGFPPYRYFWNTGDSTPYLTHLSKGSYTVKVVDKNNNEAFGSFTLKATAPLMLTLSQDRLIRCFGDSSASLKSHVMGGNPPYTYRWNTGDTISDLDALPVGNYQLAVMDSQGVEAKFSVRIEEPSPLTITDYILYPYCPNPANGAINLLVSGGVPPYSYQWNTNAQTSQIQHLSDGIYQVLVTDANACQEAGEYELRTPLTVQIEQDASIRCFGDSSATLRVNICGGAEPYRIAWNTGETTAVLHRRTGGIYTVLVVDALGNPCLAKHTVEEPQALTINGVARNPTCFGEQNGSIDVELSGGVSPYSYNWSNMATTLHLSNLSEGTYSLFAIDQNGCAVTYSATLVEPEKLQIDLGEDRTLCLGQTLSFALPDEVLTYVWQKNGVFFSSKNVVELSDTGEYTVILESENGCLALDTIHIERSQERIDAEFWHSHEAVVGEDFVVANISQTHADTVVWSVSPTAQILSESSEYFMLRFLDTGHYEIGLKVYKHGCFEQRTGVVKLLSQEENFLLRTAATSSFSDLKVFPNPAKDEFGFSVQTKKSTLLQWSLTRVGTGVVEQSGQTQSDVNGLAKQRIKLHNLARGVYVFRVICEDEGASVQLVVR